jgi:acyl carrier protein
MSESAAPPSASVAARVETVLRDVLGLEIDTVPGSSRLREDLGADSVDAVMLVMALEREFKGKISDEEAAKLSTVDDVVDYVSQRIGEQGLS